MKENYITANFEPHELVSFAQSTKIDTHENKAMHSTLFNIFLSMNDNSSCEFC